jgi:DUF4097 and DUF4098 domain-containing protein YvlB
MPKKVGIFPLAITLIVLGVSIVLTKLTGTDWFGKALSLWPLVLIAIGAEIVWWQSRSRSGDGPGWKLDGKSIFLLTLVLVISGIFHTIGSVASSLSKEGLWGFIRSWDQHGPSLKVPLFDQDLALEEADSIYIENSLGKLRVEGVEGSRAHLKAEASVNTTDQQDAEARAKNIKIEVVQGKQAKIVVNDEGFRGVNGLLRPSVNLVLQVPKKMAVSSKTNAGEVEVAGVAEVNAETDVGRVSVQKIAGNAKVRSHAGEIEAHDVGAADLQSDMGRIEVKEVKGNVKVKSNAGAIEVATSSPVGGNWDLQTDMGAIDIQFPEQSSVRFEGQTDMGSIRTPKKKSSAPDSKLTDEFGDQKYRISAQTHAGKIEVRN